MCTTNDDIFAFGLGGERAAEKEVFAVFERTAVRARTLSVNLIIRRVTGSSMHVCLPAFFHVVRAA